MYTYSALKVLQRNRDTIWLLAVLQLPEIDSISHHILKQEEQQFIVIFLVSDVPVEFLKCMNSQSQ